MKMEEREVQKREEMLQFSNLHIGTDSIKLLNPLAFQFELQFTSLKNRNVPKLSPNQFYSLLCSNSLKKEG